MDKLNARLKSFKYAFQGIVDLIKSTPNAQIHLFLACVTIIAGFYFHISLQEWCMLTLTIALVLAAEAFNTSIEYLTDLVSPDYHELAGKTKDAAAGGVLLCAIGAAIIGIIIFLPKFIALFT